MNITIVGNGGFGTAMAMVCHRAGHEVSVWGHDPEYTAEIGRTRRNPRYLPADLEIPHEIRITSDSDFRVGGGVILTTTCSTTSG